MKIIFFDLETQYLFSDIKLSRNDPAKLKLAVAGTLSDNKHSFFHENQAEDLFKTISNADLIVGHNLFRFDYRVLQPYIDADIVETVGSKTFDTMLELEKQAGCWTSLDDLCKRNVGLAKTVDSKKIPKMWRDDRHQEVRDYLLNDLKMTEAIYNHCRIKKKIKFEYKEYGKSFGEREVEVDW